MTLIRYSFYDIIFVLSYKVRFLKLLEI